MSHITTVKTFVRSLPAARKACARLGWTFMPGQESYKWWGRWMGNTPIPEGMTQAEMGKCSHAIRVPGASYEIGLASMPDGSFQVRYDSYSTGGLSDEKVRSFLQAYATEATIDAVTSERHAGSQWDARSEERLADGTIEVEFEEV